jgi:hypothetical protein
LAFQMHGSLGPAALCPEDSLMRKASFATILAAFCSTSLLIASSASANSIPTRTRSDYGGSPSTIVTGPTSFNGDGGLNINGESFCADNSIQPDNTCNLTLDYQIQSPLPAGATSLTITIPLPTGTSLVSTSPTLSFGIMTNGDTFTGDPIYFSPFSETFAAGLTGSVGLNGSGNPFITITDPLSLPGNGVGLSLFVDLSDNSSFDSNGSFCFQTTVGGCTNDLPAIGEPVVSISTSTTAPEPGTLFALLPGLGFLAFYRRRFRR